MKNTKIRFLHILPLAAALMLSACGGDHDSHEGHAAVHQGGVELEISLDDGSKWKMDEHTRTVFKTMAERVEATGDIEEVATGLQADLDQLIQGCTMTGEAHNQLHVFLMSYIPAVQDVSEKGSKESLEKVRALLEAYPRYFE